MKIPFKGEKDLSDALYALQRWFASQDLTPNKALVLSALMSAYIIQEVYHKDREVIENFMNLVFRSIGDSVKIYQIN